MRAPLHLHLRLRLRLAAALVGVAAACGGVSSYAPYSAANAPSSCRELLPAVARDRCVNGDGDACFEAVRRHAGDVVDFRDAMNLVARPVQDERVSCVLAFTERGCALDSAVSCSALGNVHRSEGHRGPAKAAYERSCRLGYGNACLAASEIATPPTGPWPEPSRESRLLAERGCDVGSPNACMALAELTLFGGPRPFDPQKAVAAIRARRADVTKGLVYWERACLRATHLVPGEVCAGLRDLLTVVEAPRLGDDHWLPLYAEAVLMANNEAVAPPPRGDGGGPKGICDLDPAACPSRQAAPFPRELIARAPSEMRRILGVHKAACDRGDGRGCVRLLELEMLRFPHSLAAERRNLGAPLPEEVKHAPTDLCTRGVAEACVLASFPGRREYPGARTSYWNDLEGACNRLPLACAIAGNILVQTRQSPRDLFTRACRGGVAWACSP